MKQITSFFLLILTIFPFSCKKEGIPNLSLPAVTQTGENTLGFVVDGKVWTNYGRRCVFTGCSDNAVSAYLCKQPNGDIDLGISAGFTIQGNAIDQAFYISTTNITATGSFALDSSLDRKMRFIADAYTQSYKEYRNIIANKCFLTITKFDTTNKIVAGTFTAILYNPSNLNDSAKIADGRFDAKLDYR